MPGGIWSTPAYFQGTVYYGDVGGTLKAFGINQALLGVTPTSQTTMSFGYPGTSPAVSANGSTNGIVWAVENSQPAVLHAFAAGNLATELYNSNQAANGRDQFRQGQQIHDPDDRQREGIRRNAHGSRGIRPSVNREFNVSESSV